MEIEGKSLRNRELELQNELTTINNEEQESPLAIEKAKRELELAEVEVALQKRKVDLEKEKEVVDSAVDEHKEMDLKIKNDLKELKERKLGPVLEKVPGLSFDSGKFFYEKKSIDELSGSEIIELSIKLLSLRDKGTLICINEAEALDDTTIENMKWDDDKDFILIRVADNPTKAKNFKSLEIKNQEVKNG